ncbi:M50 family metallopeptidase [Heliophilum fasciatum]|uniref:Stage IV sporulation protein FB n=1 Tax=Heliophilum fasciatum TaxID=35700 RepID=A0A4R2SAJ2_9FIRM|nr:M50 family metallopeptidase [Heliophilum fasciatum]MCW2277128.1 stage IV sporulation protein FB [Heliophilum fasciatum]TCP68235.1 stage IV sporulation protein FB [Heliophilum fasciatum]
MKIGRLAGVDLRVNEWLLLFSAFYVWAGVGLAMAVAFLSVAWHEWGHVLAARRAGFVVREVELFPFGGVARLESGMAHAPQDEMRVALAGPAFSFGLVVASAALAMTLNQMDKIPFDNGLAQRLIDEGIPYIQTVNITLALFNLLPVAPLDGGRLLRALLTERLGALRATAITAGWGEGLSIGLAFLGVVGLYYRVTGLDVPLLAALLWLGARKERRSGTIVFWQLLKAKAAQLQGTGPLSGDVVIAKGSTPLSALLGRIAPNRCLLVVVTDSSGSVIGQIAESKILSAVSERPEATLEDLLVPTP